MKEKKKGTVARLLGFAVAGIVVYFFALTFTHLAAFRTATNIRKRCIVHLAEAHLGYFG